MGNLGTTIKRFLSNKNTVTLLAIIVCTVLLYFVYKGRVSNAVQTEYICAARETIPARSEITADMVTQVKVLSSQITSNTVRNCGNVVGMYASYATEIPQNSLFYTSMLMTESEMPDSAFQDIPDGYTLYNLDVTFQSTYGNSIFPGTKIDLYLRATDEAGLPIYGKFIESIEVLAVKDANGQNVFETTVETRTPSQLLFSVPEDLYLLLKKTEILGLEIVIVPRNSNYSAKPGDTLVSSTYLKDLILDQTGEIPDECIENVTGTAECRLAVDNTTRDSSTDDTTNTAEEETNTETNNE